MNTDRFTLLHQEQRLSEGLSLGIPDRLQSRSETSVTLQNMLPQNATDKPFSLLSALGKGMCLKVEGCCCCFLLYIDEQDLTYEIYYWVMVPEGDSSLCGCVWVCVL